MDRDGSSKGSGGHSNDDSNDIAPTNNDPADKEVKNNPVTVDGHSLAADMTNAPSFITTQVVRYLREASNNRSWQQLISVWLGFEKNETVFGVGFSSHLINCSSLMLIWFLPQKLSTTNRPSEVALWIKQHLDKKHVPIRIKPDAFGQQLLAWWKALQPTWRLLPDGTMSKDVPREEKWATIRKGGSAGLYTVIMAVSWWVVTQANLDEDQDQGIVWDIVEDFTWILNQLQASHTGSKRSLENDSDEATTKSGKGKRRYVFFYFNLNKCRD